MSAPTRPLLLGHRGARSVCSIPENRLESFDRALADGCDGFEFDVRLTADDQVVICHDPRFGGIEIAASTAARLAPLPNLKDVLAGYQARAFLDIELKVSGLEKITLELVRKYPPQKGFVVSSFLPEILLTLHAQNAAVPLGLICDTRARLVRWKELPVEYVIPHHKCATASLVTELKKASKKVFVWTVNNPAHMLQLRDLGVDGIISDDTQLLCRTLSAGESTP